MNQVEVKRRQIQSFSYVLACINIWVFGKSIGDNGLGYLAAAVLVFALFWVLTGKNLPDRMGPDQSLRRAEERDLSTSSAAHPTKWAVGRGCG